MPPHGREEPGRQLKNKSEERRFPPPMMLPGRTMRSRAMQLVGAEAKVLHHREADQLGGLRERQRSLLTFPVRPIPAKKFTASGPSVRSERRRNVSAIASDGVEQSVKKRSRSALPVMVKVAAAYSFLSDNATFRFTYPRPRHTQRIGGGILKDNHRLGWAVLMLNAVIPKQLAATRDPLPHQHFLRRRPLLHFQPQHTRGRRHTSPPKGAASQDGDSLRISRHSFVPEPAAAAKWDNSMSTHHTQTPRPRPTAFFSQTREQRHNEHATNRSVGH